MLPAEDTAGHVARRRADLDSALGAEDKVRRGFFMDGGRIFVARCFR